MRRAGVLLLVLSLMIGCDSRDREDRYASTVLILDPESIKQLTARKDGQQLTAGKTAQGPRRVSLRNCGTGSA